MTPARREAPRGVAVLGAPMESEALLQGVNLMPAALRAAGLHQALRSAGAAADDLGDLPISITDARRHPDTGIVAYEQVCAATSMVRDGVLSLLDGADVPLVLGGCCGILVGIFAALHERYRTVGLAFVDGHLDYYDGATAPAGALADMELRVLTGRGARPLVCAGGEPPLLLEEHTWVLGFRDLWEMRAAGAPDPTRELPLAHFVDDAGVRRHGPREVGRLAARRLADAPGLYWLHVDLDVLCTRDMPAVDYVLPGGLAWDELTQLLRPLATAPELVGMDVTIYNPSLDPERRLAPRIVRLLTDVLGVAEPTGE